eukprot:CAMPEP_0197835638 /NCGR_PEP_ID=MMETSP1437-20131217/26460_1 /TAXON_ID=49252 ORGANISM="Eucampia antarctica, Strain CCMP1452" /NCGR_SAMPLE_ID=MMETSP1437 /ASSEMBLY_ACC=CAM_ASM_001096 /LENGTH=60 /DNA_ID=CAMNT_0043441233 /DNA_START=283 /DNA_END=465 /DNA_ORIENTATION=-
MAEKEDLCTKLRGIKAETKKCIGKGGESILETTSKLNANGLQNQSGIAKFCQEGVALMAN